MRYDRRIVIFPDIMTVRVATVAVIDWLRPVRCPIREIKGLHATVKKLAKIYNALMGFTVTGVICYLIFGMSNASYFDNIQTTIFCIW